MNFSINLTILTKILFTSWGQSPQNDDNEWPGEPLFEEFFKSLKPFSTLSEFSKLSLRRAKLVSNWVSPKNHLESDIYWRCHLSQISLEATFFWYNAMEFSSLRDSIHFSSNHSIHKSLSEAQKYSRHILLWMLWFDKKVYLVFTGSSALGIAP